MARAIAGLYVSIMINLEQNVENVLNIVSKLQNRTNHLKTYPKVVNILSWDDFQGEEVWKTGAFLAVLLIATAIEVWIHRSIFEGWLGIVMLGIHG